MNREDALRKNMEGLKLYQEGKYEEALRLFNEAIESDPENAAAMLNRSDVYKKLGREVEADADREKWTMLKSKPKERDAEDVQRHLEKADSVREKGTREKASAKMKTWKERYDREGVNWLKGLPLHWLREYLKGVIIHFLVSFVIACVIVYFVTKDMNIDNKLIIILGIGFLAGIFTAVMFAIPDTDKTPLVKYRFIRWMCAVLRKKSKKASRTKGWLAVIFGIVPATGIVALGVIAIGEWDRSNLGIALIVVGVLAFLLVCFLADKYGWDIPDAPPPG